METILQGVVAKLTYRNGGFGVWVCDVVAQLQSEGYDITREEFSQWALSAHKANTVTLRRCDLVSAQWANKITASEIKGLAGSTFHTIEA